MRKRNVIKSAVFIAVFIVLLAGVSKILLRPTDNYQRVTGSYHEPVGSLDAIFVGPSNAYTAWIAPLAWQEHGITVYGYTSAGQPLPAVRYIIEDARKRQPDALYVVCINGYSVMQQDAPTIHSLTDYFPASAVKYRLIRALCQMSGFSRSESLEYYFPLIRYHSRWNELVKDDFGYEEDRYKTTDALSNFLTWVDDGSSGVLRTSIKEELTEDQRKELELLLDYCQTEHINAMFVYVPTLRQNEQWLARKNSALALCSEWGFPVLDLTDGINYDLTQDFYGNLEHMNIHGAVKVTRYLSDYLTEHYGFVDKRGDPAYSSWDEAYENYSAVARQNLLDIEWDNMARVDDLSAPELLAATADGAGVSLSWRAVDGADGYRIYRKSEGSAWTELATVDDTVLCWEDICSDAGEYYYTVIGFQEQNSFKRWGRYDYVGLNVTVNL